ncbi:MAG: hypothetical protein A3C79_02575 [Candidatus Taylorbacteria bacterium RIFCSPHIGHO2_02_FULL_45_28]|nr:MAG: hypothetical protein A3C79_02575 [Candidatus Taylorbacteria bacterium RIFCSPHIGHO2_02_FULL_45_28]OHA45322.1 MAG: hypothetical protein A3G04_03585 [Candidatus Taylorbacteria bacterium RIFCSPLOWO2_12_FULL_44_9]
MAVPRWNLEVPPWKTMAFIPGEYYHLYNRGAHKAPIFLDQGDYMRFLQLLYVMNNQKQPQYRGSTSEQVFRLDRGGTSVDIISYCLMPNHFHLAIRETIEGGTHRFVHKLCTGYSMYYNNKYDHSGTIFQGSCKSKHVGNDEYLRYLIQYIHLNPFGIKEPDMNKLAKTEYLDEAISYSRNYDYSSFKDYLGETRPQASILANCRGGTSVK